ncbi:ATP-binding protein [Microbacterium sp. A8/3-1]|uniref:ATP-binding protein n=1 Tax=Microbacterium sp. A8/3-1 TaxID=3160749 RepID=A0AAU7VXX6_9MICO
MALPTTLDSWREFVLRTQSKPDELTAKQISALTAAARESYDRQRVRWLSADIVLETPDVRQLRRLWAILSAEALSDAATLSRTLAVSGAPTYGKTTAVMWVAKQHERRQRQRHPLLSTTEFQPSVYVVTPAATTPKMLMISFCNTLGIPHTRSQTAQELTEQVVHVLRTLRTSLVVLDEIHNVHSNRQMGAEAASVLKLFAERLDAAFLFAGIDLPRSPVFAGPVGEQLAGRAMKYEMVGYASRSAEGRAEWRELVATLNDLLPLAEQPDDALNHAADFLFDASGGSIGQLRALLRRAAIEAILTGREHVVKADLQHLATITRSPEASSAGHVSPSAPRAASA